MDTQIRPLIQADRHEWEELARAYKGDQGRVMDEAAFDMAFERLLTEDGMYGLMACMNGKAVGFSHYLFHANIWNAEVCYLQDIYTVPAYRGRGVAYALLSAVADQARSRDIKRLYWMVGEHNTSARSLYDKVAKFDGLLRYEYTF